MESFIGMVMVSALWMVTVLCKLAVMGMLTVPWHGDGDCPFEMKMTVFGIVAILMNYGDNSL